MKNKQNYFMLVFFVLLCIGGGTGNAQVDTSRAASDSSGQDTVWLKASFNEEDIPANEYLDKRLQPIRTNFKRINSITNWSAIDTEILSETGEGGEAKYYYQNGALEKIITRRFGETDQLLTEYYLLDGQLSFVLERSYRYNRPMYYDTVAMKANNDTVAFNFDKSTIIEDRSYFEKGKLIHQINNQDCGAAFSAAYLVEEQKRIRSDFEKLIGLAKNK